MNDQIIAARVFSSAVASHIEAMAMMAENQVREHRGESPAFNGDAFIELAKQHHNYVQTILQGGIKP